MIPRSTQNICPTPKSYLNYPISMAENSSTFEARKIGGSSHLASGTPQTPSPLMDDPWWSSKSNYPQPPVRPWHSPNPHPASYLPHFARPAPQLLGPAGRTSARRGRRGELQPRGRLLPAVPQGMGRIFIMMSLIYFIQKNDGDWMVAGWWCNRFKGNMMVI